MVPTPDTCKAPRRQRAHTSRYQMYIYVLHTFGNTFLLEVPSAPAPPLHLQAVLKPERRRHARVGAPLALRTRRLVVFGAGSGGGHARAAVRRVHVEGSAPVSTQ
jgi:hypothetical protein